jgi:hypothetical protein
MKEGYAVFRLEGWAEDVTERPVKGSFEEPWRSLSVAYQVVV